MIYVSYLDNYLVENNEKFGTTIHQMNEGYLMVPVCHEKKEIVINTNVLVYASFENARPTETSEFNNIKDKLTITIPADKIQIPGYVYIHFTSQPTDQGFI